LGKFPISAFGSIIGSSGKFLRSATPRGGKMACKVEKFKKELVGPLILDRTE